MIKKQTIASFKDGNYAGDHDWKGGIPLSINEEITVTVGGEDLIYKLVDKEISMVDDGEDQEVVVKYYFEEQAN